MSTAIKRCSFIKPELPDAELHLPDVVAGCGNTSSFGVVLFGDVEVELNDSVSDYLPEYFSVASAAPDDEITLGTGWATTVGRIDGDGRNGYCFGVQVGQRCLLGHTPATVGLDALAGWLTDLHIEETAVGLNVTPNRATWSPHRQANCTVLAQLQSGRTCLLDVRPAYRASRSGAPGFAVAGGTLAKVSTPGRPEYLTLSTPAHVLHMLSSSDDLDELARLGSELTVRSLIN